MAKEITQPTDEQIRTRAYFLWESDGCPQGRDWDYWLKAKEQLEAQDEPGTTGVIAATPTRKSTQTASKRRASARTPAYA